MENWARPEFGRRGKLTCHRIDELFKPNWPPRPPQSPRRPPQAPPGVLDKIVNFQKKRHTTHGRTSVGPRKNGLEVDFGRRGKTPCQRIGQSFPGPQEAPQDPPGGFVKILFFLEKFTILSKTHGGSWGASWGPGGSLEASWA